MRALLDLETVHSEHQLLSSNFRTDSTPGKVIVMTVAVMLCYHSGCRAVARPSNVLLHAALAIIYPLGMTACNCCTEDYQQGLVVECAGRRCADSATVCCLSGVPYAERSNVNGWPTTEDEG
jgi:hypothetical protein